GSRPGGSGPGGSGPSGSRAGDGVAAGGEPDHEAGGDAAQRGLPSRALRLAPRYHRDSFGAAGLTGGAPRLAPPTAPPWPIHGTRRAAQGGPRGLGAGTAWCALPAGRVLVRAGPAAPSLPALTSTGCGTIWFPPARHRSGQTPNRDHAMPRMPRDAPKWE